MVEPEATAEAAAATSGSEGGGGFFAAEAGSSEGLTMVGLEWRGY